MTDDNSSKLVILLVLIALVLSVVFTWKVLDHQIISNNNEESVGNAVASQPHAEVTQGKVGITILPAESSGGA